LCENEKIKLSLVFFKLFSPKKFKDKKQKDLEENLQGLFSLAKAKLILNYLLLIAACAAASLAIGTRKGEQET
jgi:hypothetical protein